jgi:DNA-binding Lrp family transcriptional regulator
MNTPDLELRLLNDFQRDFPLAPAPFGEIARRLGVAESEVLATLRRLHAGGAVSRVGAVFRPHRVGASTLAAMAVPPARLDEVARRVNACPEVNHNYQREHRFNLWFVVTAESTARVRAVLAEIERASGCPLLYLPMEEDYHIDLGFDLTGAPHEREKAPLAARAHQPLPSDRALIAAIQDGLPLTHRPYRDIARQTGRGEGDVIRRLGEMLAGGAIKRLGVIVRHHELGFHANAMAVWDVPDAVVSRLGHRLAGYDFITLCYRRQRQLPEWRYNLYCMIHGRDRETVRHHLDTLRRECGLDAFPHEFLFSLKRFKQCGARYATPPGEEARAA